tara:strand:- start:573 stop:836 length:264 start_codon:yes stop_codon:yes gene_type:complete
MPSKISSQPRTPSRSTHRRRRRATSRSSTRKTSHKNESSLLQRIGSLERNQETMRRVMNRLTNDMKKLLKEKEKGRPPSGMYAGGGK